MILLEKSGTAAVTHGDGAIPTTPEGTKDMAGKERDEIDLMRLRLASIETCATVTSLIAGFALKAALAPAPVAAESVVELRKGLEELVDGVAKDLAPRPDMAEKVRSDGENIISAVFDGIEIEIED
ncbi:hypothetical protein IWQ49_000061 [Labrenzia sp. EL_126]|nr:hypothetical protein [Labrenzia sp. EL_126]